MGTMKAVVIREAGGPEVLKLMAHPADRARSFGENSTEERA
jgi:hypothetical protein